jgi:hypothetical protein
MGSSVIFVHPLGHTSGLSGGHEQAPDAHVAPFGHAFPHAPQFFGSSATFVHPLAHASGVAGGQTHEPAEHVAPFGQTFPHPPQFAGSVAVTTHAPIQETASAAHAHAFCTQCSCGPQAVPHPPQFWSSSSGMQLPLQSFSGLHWQ